MLRTGMVQDAVWSPQFVALARRTQAAIVPLYVSGGNSTSFYALGLLHGRIRTSLLLREFFAHRGTVI